MKKQLIGILIITLTYSCKAQYSTDILKNNFSAEQINDLKKITEFFKSQLCDNPKKFKECYKNLPPEYTKNGAKPISDYIDFEKQKELYKQISKSTFNEIWNFCKTTYPESGLEFKSICSKYNGKYQKYLTEYGKKNKTIKIYANRIIGSGDFNALDIQQWQILNDKKDFDLDNPNIQLILAIHYLSINDHRNRKEKWEMH